jgi:hypothetical protein
MCGLLDRLRRTCGDAAEPSVVVIDSRSCRLGSSCFDVMQCVPQFARRHTLRLKISLPNQPPPKLPRTVFHYPSDHPTLRCRPCLTHGKPSSNILPPVAKVGPGSCRPPEHWPPLSCSAAGSVPRRSMQHRHPPRVHAPVLKEARNCFGEGRDIRLQHHRRVAACQIDDADRCGSMVPNDQRVAKIWTPFRRTEES